MGLSGMGERKADVWMEYVDGKGRCVHVCVGERLSVEEGKKKDPRSRDEFDSGAKRGKVRKGIQREMKG